VLTTTTAGNQNRSQTATVGDTYTFGPTMLNSFHATFNRRRNDRGAAPNLISPATLGIDIHQLLFEFHPGERRFESDVFRCGMRHMCAGAF